MADALVIYEPYVRLAAFASVLALMAFWELVAPRRTQAIRRSVRWPSNIAISQLSDLTLDFLLSRVSSGYAANAMSTSGEESWGLYLNAVNASMQPPGGPEQTDAFKVHPDPLGQVRRWNSALFNYMPRDLPSHAVFSESIFERMTKATLLYAPQSLFDHHRALSAKRTALDTELKSLAATGSLSPAELDQVLAIKDSLRLTRHPKRLDSVEFHNLSERLRNPVPEIAAPVS